MTKITDINGAAMQPLRSIKKPQINESFSSKIKDSKLKQASEEIVSALLSSIKSSDEYTIQLHSKMSDVVLGRLAFLKAQNDVSTDDLIALKDSINDEIQKNSGLPKEISEQLQQTVSTTLNSAQPSDDSSKVIDELKNLNEQIDQSAEQQDNNEQPASTKDDESSNEQPIQTDTTFEDQQTESIEDIKKLVNQLIDKINELPNSVDSSLQKPFNQLNSTIEKLSKKIKAPIQNQTSDISSNLGSIQDGIAKQTESISQSFSEMKDTTIDGITKKVEETQQTTAKINPIKKLFSKSNDDKKREKFEKFKKSYIPNFLAVTKEFAADQQAFVLAQLKANMKKLQKAFAKMLVSFKAIFVKKIVSSISKILDVIIFFLWRLLATFITAVIIPIATMLSPIFAAIAISLGLILAAFANALLKFPELVGPIVESLAKLAELMANVAKWLITEVFTWITGTFWPFIKEEVWGFISNELWTFISERVFPIIERIYNWIWNEFWPFLCNELWPFVLEQIGKVVDWLTGEFWPFILEMYSWLRDTIITPVWEKFVVPVLTWIVEKVMPFIAAHVAPIIATILEILNEFLEAIKPWIEPIFGKIMFRFKFILELIQKVLKILEPGLMALINCVKNLFIGVFNLLKDVVISIVEFIGLLIKAFKQAWNQLCSYFADITIEIRTPSSWWAFANKCILGPYKPFSFMNSMKFDMGSPSAKSSPTDPANPETTADEDDKALLEKLDNYIDSAYGKIFLALRTLMALLGVDPGNNPKLKVLVGGSFAVKELRKVDATKKLEKFADNPLTKILKLIDSITLFIDDNITTAVNELAKATGHADLTVAESTSDVEDKQQEQGSTFDANEFVNELFGDESDEPLKTDEDNAFSFLVNNVFPYMNDNIRPLVMRVRELADGIKPTNNSVVNILEGNQQEDMNYALVDQ